MKNAVFCDIKTHHWVTGNWTGSTGSQETRRGALGHRKLSREHWVIGNGAESTGLQETRRGALGHRKRGAEHWVTGKLGR
jgi:hypothetical protein